MVVLRVVVSVRGAFMANVHFCGVSRGISPRLCLGRQQSLQQHTRSHISFHIARKTAVVPSTKCQSESFHLHELEKQIVCKLSQTLPLIVNATSTNALVMVVGVSGGCDSTALLHALVRSLSSAESASTELSFQLSDTSSLPCSVHVAHFDHQQRGVESDRDREFVQQLCEDYKLPLHSYFWDQDHSNSCAFSQDTARTWRRSRMGALLESLTTENKPGVILTAHHADDSLESMLLKILRGAHITNIQGMDSVTQDSSGNWIVRPLLSVDKKDIVNYLEERSLDWREDLSNASNKYLRNQIRNELVPLLSDIVGGNDILQRRLENLSRQSREIREDLRSRATDYLNDSGSGGSWFVLPLEGPALIHKEAFYLWARQRTGSHQISYDSVERVWSQVIQQPTNQEWTINLGQGWNVIREGNLLRLETTKAEELSVEEITHSRSPIELNWSIDHGKATATTAEENSLRLLVSSETMRDIAGIYVSNVRNENLPFTPSWRKGRSPSKSAQILRGQGVGIFERREAYIIFALKHDGTKSAVAIKVPTTGEWLLDSSVVESSDGVGVTRILISLPEL